MPIALIIQFLIALPSLIKMVMDIIAAIRGIGDEGEKAEAQAEFESIKQSIFRKKGVGSVERTRLEDLRRRLKAKVR
jgi:hypothetical protein